jgi:tetratricopeptide (TPR) repeat protein
MEVKKSTLAPLLLLLALVAHLPALWSGMIWDDQIIRYDQLIYFGGLRDVFFPPAGLPNWSETYYRPLITLSYLLDFRHSVALAHASNLALHLLATALVGLLARRLLGAGHPWAVALATAVFAVHPVHVESVNWISGRTDVLATVGVLATLLLTLRWHDHRSVPALAGGALALLLALLAKEVAIVALVLFPLVWWLAPARDPAPARREARRRIAIGMAALAGATAIYGLARLSAGIVVGEPPGFGPVVLAIGTARVVAWYLVKLVVPWPMHNLVGWGMLPGPLVAALIVLSAAAVLFIAWRRWRRAGDGLPLLAGIWIALALAPAVWIAFAPGLRAPVAERYLYLPSVGLALGAGWLLTVVRARWSGAGAALVIAAFTLGTFAWGLTWSSNVRLWTHATGRSPGNVFAWHSLARAWREAGDLGAARAAYRRGLDAEKLPYERSKVYYGLAEISLIEGDLDEARRLMESSRREFPEFVRAGYGLGLVAMLQAGAASDDEARRARAEATREFRAALRAIPDFHEARLALVQVTAAEVAALRALGEHEQARSRSREALRELEALERALPGARLAGYLREAEAGLVRDPAVLRAGLLSAADAGA